MLHKINKKLFKIYINLCNFYIITLIYITIKEKGGKEMSWFSIGNDNKKEIERKISDLESKKRSLESDLRRAESNRDDAKRDVRYYGEAENDRNHKDYWRYEDAVSRHCKYSREVKNLEEDIWDVRIDISNLEREL